MKLWRKFGKTKNLVGPAMRHDVIAERKLLSLKRAQAGVAFSQNPGVSVQMVNLLQRGSVPVQYAHDYQGGAA